MPVPAPTSRRGDRAPRQPRRPPWSTLKPPFPAVAGLYARPTVVNNVESIASVPSILLHSADWFNTWEPRTRPASASSSSGHVKNPGQYEAPMGITMRELLDLAGGMRHPSFDQFWTPGGSSTPLFTNEHLDVPLEFGAVAKTGSMLGTRALRSRLQRVCRAPSTGGPTTSTSPVAVHRAAKAPGGSSRSSAGSSTGGAARPTSTSSSTSATTSSAAASAPGDGATSPITSAIQYFRDEYIRT